MIYAVIENGIVSNVISLSDYNSIDFPDAVKCGDVAAAIGDSYIDGAFFRNGEKLLTLEEQLAELRAALAALYSGVTE